MSNRLKGQTAWISGGASGIGAETGRRMVAEGARVALTDRNTELGLKVAAEIGPAARFLPHDVTSESEWKRAVSEAESAFGRLDVVHYRRNPQRVRLNEGGLAPIAVRALQHEHARLEMTPRPVDLGVVHPGVRSKASLIFVAAHRATTC